MSFPPTFVEWKYRIKAKNVREFFMLSSVSFYKMIQKRRPKKIKNNLDSKYYPKPQNIINT
jgi:hypothetical protein